MTRNFLTLALLTAAIPAFCIAPASAQTNDDGPQWENVPLACLPPRAEEWEDEDDMEPCHCPPKEMCPEKPEISLADLKILVNGNELFEIDDTFTATVEELLGGQAQAAIEAYIRSKGFRNNGGSVHVEIILSEDSPALQDWINDNLDLPLQLAIQCCESICPKGAMIEIIDIEIPNPEDPPCIEDAEEEEEEEEDVPTDLPPEEEEEEEEEEECTPPPSWPETITIQTLRCSQDYDVPVPREGCILEGTMVSLSDGTEKPIESLAVGDKVKGKDGEVAVIAINRFTQSVDKMLSINGGKPFITTEHPVLTTEGWKSFTPDVTSSKSGIKVIGQLAEGDTIITADGPVKIESLKLHMLNDGVVAYNLKTGGDGSFIANDIVVQGFSQVQIHY